MDNLLLWLSLGVVILFFTAPLTVGAIGGGLLLAVILYNKAYFEKIPVAVKVAEHYLINSRNVPIISIVIFIVLIGLIFLIVSNIFDVLMFRILDIDVQREFSIKIPLFTQDYKVRYIYEPIIAFIVYVIVIIFTGYMFQKKDPENNLHKTIKTQSKT